MVSCGIHCTSSAAFLVVVDGESIVPAVTERITWSAAQEGPQALDTALHAFERAYVEAGVTAVGVLQRESQHTASHQTFWNQIALESMAFLAAHNRGLPAELLPRPTVRARLKLPRSAGLDSHVVFEPTGRYWSAGRNLASMAALALEQT